MVTQTSFNTAAPASNPIMAVNDIFALLNRAMLESAMLQGSAARDVAGALQQVADILKSLNIRAAEINGQIDKHNKEMEALAPAMEILGIVLGALTVLAPVAGGIFGADAGAIANLATAAAGVANGGVAIANGQAELQLADCTHELAGYNGKITGLGGAQQNLQSTTRWMGGQIENTFSSMSSIAKTTADGVRGISDGIARSGHDALRAVLRSNPRSR